MKKKTSEKTKTGRAPVVKGRNYRLVIPNLEDYKDATLAQLMTLKGDALAFLKQNQKHRGLQYYSIAVETHPTSGIPHLDILLLYAKSVQTSLNRFDKLLKHGNLTRYKKLNDAILSYNLKEDLSPLSNLPTDLKNLVDIQDLKKDSYLYLYLKMKQDVMHFNLEQYVESHNLSQHISGWSSLKTKLKDMQLAAANLQLKERPGFATITNELIKQKLTPLQLHHYYSWSGYQTIVDYLNQVPKYSFRRPLKTKNLLITGPPNCGKSSLIYLLYPEPHQNPLSNYIPVYKMGVKGWFPQYQSEVYRLIYWNEAKLTAYSYDTILELLEGSPMTLPIKGGFRKKMDNPLVIMTSNMTLQQMIQQKFNYNQDYQRMARENLAVRVQNVLVPPGYDLFLLQKLLKHV